MRSLRSKLEEVLGWLESGPSTPIVMSPTDVIRYERYRIAEAIKMLRKALDEEKPS